MIEIAGERVKPGERRRIDLPVTRRYTHSDVSIPVEVVCGRKAGPTLFVCAAIHGDEINGVEIVRRLLRRTILRSIKGTLLAIPVVNVHGFVSKERYLPDRRDLNRAFPGTARGSLTSRVAHVFMEEIVSKATHGIDLHTGSHHRTNLPQIRACLDQPETERLARAFGAPVIIDANLRDGSLRQAVLERELPMLLYEAGEALRFDEVAIRAGVRGVIRVMRSIDMLRPIKTETAKPFIARSTRRVRAPDSGIVHGGLPLGARVERGDVIAQISDPLGTTTERVSAPVGGIIIGRNNLPLVNEGDSLYHIASFARPRRVAESVESFVEEFDD